MGSGCLQAKLSFNCSPRSPGRAREVLLQLPDEKDQERQHRHLLPHQPRVPAPGCDVSTRNPALGVKHL